MASVSKVALGAIGVCGATLFTAVSAGQGLITGYNLGAATSELHGDLWAAGFLAGSLLNAAAWCASGLAMRRRQFVRGFVAAVLGVICFGAAALASLSLIAGGRGDVAASREKAADLFHIERQRAQAALAELSAINAEPRGNKKAQAVRAQRRIALERTVAEASKALHGDSAPLARDDVAESLKVYLSTAGVQADAATISIWTNLAIVIFIEAGSALGFIVVGILIASDAVPVRPKIPAEELPAETEETETAERRRGRRRSALPADIVDRIRAAGGSLSGSLPSIARVIGVPSKSTAHRTLRELEAAGTLTLEASPEGTRVSLS